LYFSATHSVVSGALVIEKEATQVGASAKQQYLVYFVSKVLSRFKNTIPKSRRVAMR
jgi:hypothetical protein